MKRKSILFVLVSLMSLGLVAQSKKEDTSFFSKLSIGGYGQVDYNQQLNDGEQHTGKLDLHRFVLYVGYQFSPKVHFFSEVEIEHGEKVEMEQAYINYKIHPSFQLRGGLMLVPMGRINEYHEPPLYNGVERPMVDYVLIPSTWREIGFGFNGVFPTIGLRYQAYIMNGPSGYDTSQTFNAKYAIRKGRQHGANSYVNSPNLALKLDYQPVSDLNIGLAGYFGKSQSKLFNGLDRSDALAKAQADSTQVGIAMLGLDATYSTSAWQFRGEYIYASLSNTKEYNAVGSGSNLGSSMQGGYLEAGYNLLSLTKYKTQRLVPFVRYENYNTQATTEGFQADKANHWEEWVAGIGYSPVPQVVFKMDYRHRKNKADKKEEYINLGIGYVF